MFLDWLEKKQKKILEASTMSRVGMRQYHAQADIDQESFERDQNAGVKYIVITNSIKMLRDLIKAAKTGNPVDPSNYSEFRITNIDGDRATMVRNVNQTYSQGVSKVVDLDDIKEFEVTDAFKDAGIIGQNKNRYFLSARRKGTEDTLRNLMQKWLSLTTHQVVGDKMSQQDMAMTNFLGGQDKVKQKLNQGAQGAKDQFWADLGDKAMRGEDVTKLATDAAVDDETGYNALDNDRFHQKLMHIAPALFTQLKLKGVIGDLSAEEAKLVKDLQQIEAVAKAGMADQVLSGNPEVQQAIENPNSVMYAKVLGLWNAANWIESKERSSNSLFNTLRSMKPAQAEPQPSGMGQPAMGQQSGGPVGLQKLLQGEGTVFESICWKRHNDKRGYDYFSE